MFRSPSLSLPPNKKVGNYSFNNQSFLGEGSYSTVYLGINDETKQTVAIKVITRKSLTDDYMYETLASEIEILKKLDHPNILRLYDVLNTTNNVYMITEYCNGGTLDELLKKEKRFSEEQAIFVMKDILQGFREILKHNIVHRDIKPANIFVADGRFKIGDFGFAKKVDDLDEKLMKSIVGTPLYMSPECLENKLYSSKNDIYSLGVIFFKMLYGRTPWPARTRAELMQKMRASPLIIPNEQSISMHSKQFLLKSLQYRENERTTWQDIFENPLFRDQVKESNPPVINPPVHQNINHNVNNSNKENQVEPEVYEVKMEEVVEKAELKEPKANFISTHIKIIKKIDRAVRLLSEECQDINISKAIQLAVSLMKACEHQTSDLSKQVQEIKKKGNEQFQLMNQIEGEVIELENKNAEKIKILLRLQRRHEIVEQDANIEAREKGFFEEIKVILRPMIRELNHKVFEANQKQQPISHSHLELLHELLGLFQILGVLSLTNGQIEAKDHDSGFDNVLAEDELMPNYQTLRKLIYDYEI